MFDCFINIDKSLLEFRIRFLFKVVWDFKVIYFVGREIVFFGNKFLER